MKLAQLALAGLLSGSLGLGGCAAQGGPSSGDIGFILGSVGGALVGSQFGSGTGRAAATALGAVLGGYAGRIVATRLTQSDYEKMDNAAYKAVNTGEPQQWSNPETGHSGSVAPGGTFQSNGQTCRTFEEKVTAGDESATGRAVACQLPDGSWRIQA